MPNDVPIADLHLEPVARERDAVRELLAMLDEEFPFPNRAPLPLLRSALFRGVLHGTYLTDGERVYGYALYQCHPQSGCLHVLHLAIRKELRSQGLGSVLLHRLDELSLGGILLEVEDPERAEGADNRTACKRRVVYYERNGFSLVEGARFTHAGYPMRVMANRPHPAREWLPFCRALYNRVYGIPIARLLMRP